MPRCTCKYTILGLSAPDVNDTKPLSDELLKIANQNAANQMKKIDNSALDEQTKIRLKSKVQLAQLDLTGKTSEMNYRARQNSSCDCEEIINSFRSLETTATETFEPATDEATDTFEPATDEAADLADDFDIAEIETGMELVVASPEEGQANESSTPTREAWTMRGHRATLVSIEKWQKRAIGILFYGIFAKGIKEGMTFEEASNYPNQLKAFVNDLATKKPKSYKSLIKHIPKIQELLNV